MKKIVSVILLLCLLVTAVGCHHNTNPAPTAPSQSPTQPTAPKPTATTVPADPTTEPTDPSEEPSDDTPVWTGPTSVTLLPLNDEYWHNDGTVLVRIVKPEVRFETPNASVQSNIQFSLENTISNTLDDPISMLEQATEDYENELDVYFPYESSLDVVCQRLDLRVLSIRGLYYWYGGGAHPSHSSVGLNYDMQTGLELTLDQIFVDEEARQAVEDMMVAELDKHKGLYDNYKESTHLRLMADTPESHCFYFTSKGIIVFYPPYEIAPYATGEINLTLSYDVLDGYLKEEYKPVDTTDTVGHIRIDDMEKNKKEPVAVVDLTEDGIGGNMALIADDDLRDLRIESCPLLAQEKPDPTVAYTIFACDRISRGDIVNLRSDIPDTIPNLRVTYTRRDKTITRYISQSGKDGSYLLLESFD